MVGDTIASPGGRVIKFMRDAALMTFSMFRLVRGIRALDIFKDKGTTSCLLAKLNTFGLRGGRWVRLTIKLGRCFFGAGRSPVLVIELGGK